MSDCRTSELSASGGESVHDLRDVGDYESSIRRMGPRSPGSGECKLESNHDNRKSLQLDDHDEDSSLDFGLSIIKACTLYQCL